MGVMKGYTRSLIRVQSLEFGRLGVYEAEFRAQFFFWGGEGRRVVTVRWVQGRLGLRVQGDRMKVVFREFLGRSPSLNPINLI